MDVIARERELAIRRLRDAPEDYERLVRWRNEPHVRAWWDPDDPPMTVEEAVREYRPLTDPSEPATGCVIEMDARPVGYIQFYRWADEPEDGAVMGLAFDDGAWGVDIFIGEPSAVGVGVGPRAVDLLCRYLFDQRGAASVQLVAAQANASALRAYAKVGFRQAAAVLDTDTKDGRRVKSWLMVRWAPSCIDPVCTRGRRDRIG
jgi:RimJ/RimL family protein N-acetyltransferase